MDVYRENHVQKEIFQLATFDCRMVEETTQIWGVHHFAQQPDFCVSLPRSRVPVMRHRCQRYLWIYLSGQAHLCDKSPFWDSFRSDSLGERESCNCKCSHDSLNSVAILRLSYGKYRFFVGLVKYWLGMIGVVMENSMCHWVCVAPKSALPGSLIQSWHRVPRTDDNPKHCAMVKILMKLVISP